MLFMCHPEEQRMTDAKCLQNGDYGALALPRDPGKQILSFSSLSLNVGPCTSATSTCLLKNETEASNNAPGELYLSGPRTAGGHD